MLHHLFKALMPKQDEFFKLFSEQAACLKESALAFSDFLHDKDRTNNALKLNQCEKQADKISGRIYRLLNSSFSTPFRRSEIRALVGALDSIADYCEDVSRRFEIYRINEPLPDMAKMSLCVVQCVDLIAQALVLTEHVSKNAELINELCEKIHIIEDQADVLHDNALKKLYETDGVGALEHALVLERIYDLIEDVADACDDVANVLSDVVAENA